jgi:hypothetical protein
MQWEYLVSRIFTCISNLTLTTKLLTNAIATSIRTTKSPFSEWAFLLQLLTDLSVREAYTDLRRRATKPIKPKPASIMPYVSGSGTAETDNVPAYFAAPTLVPAICKA